MLLDQVAFLDQRIKQMEDQAIAALAQVTELLGGRRGRADRARLRHRPGLPGAGRRVPAGRDPRHQRVAGHRDHRRVGLNMAVFPTPATCLLGGLCRSASQSGTRHGKGKQKKGNSSARAAAGQAAPARPAPPPSSANGSRIARRRGKAIAQVAVARSIMIIAWHLLSDPLARDRDLAGLDASRTNRDKKIRTHLQGLKALGVTVAITDDEQAA